jgi:hypothetical protein
VGVVAATAALPVLLQVLLPQAANPPEEQALAAKAPAANTSAAPVSAADVVAERKHSPGLVSSTLAVSSGE